MCNKSILQVTWWVFSTVDHEIRNIHLKKKKCCTCLYSCCELINTHQLDTNDNQMYTTAISSSYLPKPSSWSWCNALPDLTLGRNMMGGAWVHANQMVLRVVICRLKSSSVGAFTWSSLRWFQLVVVWTKRKRKKKKEKNEFLCCSVFEWGTKKGFEFSVAFLFINVLHCEVLEFCWSNLSFVCWKR